MYFRWYTVLQVQYYIRVVTLHLRYHIALPGHSAPRATYSTSGVRLHLKYRSASRISCYTRVPSSNLGVFYTLYTIYGLYLAVPHVPYSPLGFMLQHRYYIAPWVSWWVSRHMVKYHNASRIPFYTLGTIQHLVYRSAPWVPCYSQGTMVHPGHSVSSLIPWCNRGTTLPLEYHKASMVRDQPTGSQLMDVIDMKEPDWLALIGLYLSPW